MATKDSCFSLKEKQQINSIPKNGDGQYSNLNLNANHKCSNGNLPAQTNIISNDSRQIGYDSFSEKSSKETSKNLWEKSDKNFKSHDYSNFCNSESQKVEKKTEVSLKNSSTLSLHIAAYENSIEATAADSDLTNKVLGSSSNSIQERYDSFEIPRQQDDDEPASPEIMQFKASQKLLDPNKNEKLNEKDSVNESSQSGSSKSSEMPMTESNPMHENSVNENDNKLQTLMKNLDTVTKDFVKVITQTKLINNIAVYPLNNSGYETFKTFLNSINDLNKFYETENSEYRIKLERLLKETSENTAETDVKIEEMKQKILNQTDTIAQMAESYKLMTEYYQDNEKNLKEKHEAEEVEMKNQLNLIKQKEQHFLGQIDIFQEQVKTAQSERDSMKFEVKEKDAKIAQLNETLIEQSTMTKDYEHKIKCLEAKLGQMKAVEVDLKNQLNSTKQKEQEFLCQFDNLNAQMNTVKLEWARLKNDEVAFWKHKFETTNSSISNANAQLLKRISDLEAMNLQLRSSVTGNQYANMSSYYIPGSSYNQVHRPHGPMHSQFQGSQRSAYMPFPGGICPTMPSYAGDQQQHYQQYYRAGFYPMPQQVTHLSVRQESINVNIPAVQKQIIGEQLFPHVSRISNDPGKIIGMLLQMDNSYLYALLENDDMLKSMVAEATAFLQSSQKEPRRA